MSKQLGANALPCGVLPPGGWCGGPVRVTCPRRRSLWSSLAGCAPAFGRHGSGLSPSEWPSLAGAEPSPVGGRLGCGRHQLMPWGSPSRARSHRRAGWAWGVVGGEAESPDAPLPGSLAELGGAPWGALGSSGCLRMQKGRLTWRLQGHAGRSGAWLLWTETGAGVRAARTVPALLRRVNSSSEIHLQRKPMSYSIFIQFCSHHHTLFSYF